MQTGRKLLDLVIAGFRAQGTTLGQWCREHRVKRENAAKALKGTWTGEGAEALVAQLVAESKAEAVAQAMRGAA